MRESVLSSNLRSMQYTKIIIKDYFPEKLYIERWV